MSTVLQFPQVRNLIYLQRSAGGLIIGTGQNRRWGAQKQQYQRNCDRDGDRKEVGNGVQMPHAATWHFQLRALDPGVKGASNGSISAPAWMSMSFFSHDRSVELYIFLNIFSAFEESCVRGNDSIWTDGIRFEQRSVLSISLISLFFRHSLCFVLFGFVSHCYFFFMRSSSFSKPFGYTSGKSCSVHKTIQICRHL